MEESKIDWCLKQKRGISFIDANINISENYFNRAKKDLNNLDKQDRVWSVIISYYVCYNSFYSVLIRYGIKSEIHSCTIELLKYFENLKGFYDFFNELKNQREEVQYYLKEPEKTDLKKVKNFIDYCELELNYINQNKIDEIKNRLKTEK